MAMEQPKLPDDEPDRLAALHALDVLDTPAEERFDRITRTAKRIFDVPIALVTLVNSSRQWFKSVQGLLLNETPRFVSLCAHAILREETLVVPDASKDPRFHDNPLVLGDPHIRFYAGEPLRGADGSKLGTLCIIDRRPRTLDEGELQALRDLAAWAQNELRIGGLTLRERELLKERGRLERGALIDPITRAWSRVAMAELLPREMARALREGEPLAVAVVGLDGLKAIRESQGPRVRDLVLREAAQRIRSGLRAYDMVGRHGEEEFMILLPGCTSAEAAQAAERLRARIESTLIQAGTVFVNVTARAGVASGNVSSGSEPFLAAAEHALSRAREEDDRRVEIVPVF
jgi:diguanylate cyclase (GGDEF)-like protein